DLARNAAIAVDNALLFRGADAARLQARESLAVLDSVFAAAPVGMALMDTAFRYVRVNEALARMNGLPADEHFGRTLRDVLGDARRSVLAEASQRLASTLDYETTLAELASLLVPDFADWYAVDVLDDDGRFRRLEVVHKDPAKAIWGERSKQLYAPEPGESEGTARVVRTGQALLYRTISDELLVSSTKDAEHYRILHELGMESAMVVPLTAAGRTFGALMLVSADPARLYDEEDLDFAMHLARRAAIAVDNARLYREAEERARAALVVEPVADGVVLVERDGIIRPWHPD